MKTKINYQPSQAQPSKVRVKIKKPPYVNTKELRLFILERARAVVL